MVCGKNEIVVKMAAVIPNISMELMAEGYKSYVILFSLA